MTGRGWVKEEEGRLESTGGRSGFRVLLNGEINAPQSSKRWNCVCVWDGLDGLTKVGRNGQKGSVDGKGQPHSWMASWINNKLIITKMRSFSVMCGGVMGVLWGETTQWVWPLFTPLPSCLEPVVAQELKALQVKSSPGRKYFQSAERNNSLVRREASWNIDEV